MFLLKSQLNARNLAKAQYVQASQQDLEIEQQAKVEFKKLIISPKGLGAIAGLGIVRGITGNPISSKKAGMLLGRRLLSAWLGGSAANAADSEQESTDLADAEY